MGRSRADEETKFRVLDLWCDGRGLSIHKIGAMLGKRAEVVRCVITDRIYGVGRMGFDAIYEAARSGDWRPLKEAALKNIVRKVLEDDIVTCKWVIIRKDDGSFGEKDGDGKGAETAEGLGV